MPLPALTADYTGAWRLTPLHLLSGLAKCAAGGGGLEVLTRWKNKQPTRVYGCATHRTARSRKIRDQVYEALAKVLAAGDPDVEVLAKHRPDRRQRPTNVRRRPRPARAHEDGP